MPNGSILIQGCALLVCTARLRIGSPILTEIDSAIRLHDKLLLILSVNSVGSRWVEHEVLAATTKELQQDRQGRVLFPIRAEETIKNQG